MSFFDWFKKKKKVKEGIVEKKIEISELKKEVESLKNSKFSVVYKEFEANRQQIKKLFQDISEEVDALKDLKISTEEVEAKLLVRINSAKETLGKRMGFGCKTFIEKSEPVNGFSKVNEFLEITKFVLGEISKTAKQSEITALRFKKEVNSIGLKVKKIIEIYKIMQQRYNDIGFSEFQELEQSSKKLMNLIEYRETIQRDKEDQNSSLEKEKKNLETIKNEIKQVESSSKFLAAKDNIARKKELENEQKNLKIILRNKFSEFSKAVNKAKNSPNFGEADKRIMQHYLEEPLNGLELDNDLKMNIILKTIKSAVESGIIQFDERMKNKITSTISNFIDNNELKNALDKKIKIEKEIQDLELLIKKSGIYEYNMLGVKKNDITKKIRDLETSLDVQDDLLKKNKTGIEKLKDQNEKLFAKFDVEATIS